MQDGNGGSSSMSASIQEPFAFAHNFPVRSVSFREPQTCCGSAGLHSCWRRCCPCCGPPLGPQALHVISLPSEGSAPTISTASAPPIDLFAAPETVTFEAMCDAVGKGYLSLGLYITHDKVASFTQALEDTDYLSAEEDELVNDSPMQMSSPVAVGSVDPPSGREVGGARGAMRGTPQYTSLIPSFQPSPGSATSQPSPIRTYTERPYGAKADELAKYYDIMRTADANLKDTASLSKEGEVYVYGGAGSEGEEKGTGGPAGGFAARPGAGSGKAKGPPPPIDIMNAHEGGEGEGDDPFGATWAGAPRSAASSIAGERRTQLPSLYHHHYHHNYHHHRHHHCHHHCHCDVVPLCFVTFSLLLLPSPFTLFDVR